MNPGIIRIVLILLVLLLVGYWVWAKYREEKGEEDLSEPAERTLKTGLVAFVVLAVLGIFAGTLFLSGESDEPPLNPELFTSPEGSGRNDTDKP